MDMSVRFPNLGIDFGYVAKSVRVFGFEITIYGILIAVGMLLGISFVVLQAKRYSQNQDFYLDTMIISLIAGVIGARLFYGIFSWELFRDNVMEIFNIRGGGLAFYGGLLGGTGAAAVFCRIKKQPFGLTADNISLGLLIGQVVGRWGDFFNRGSFGEYTDSLFAMQLPLSSVHAGEVTSFMRENLLAIDGVSYIQVHPAFFYESLWCLFLLVVLLVRRHKKRFDGEIFMAYLAGYGFGRFFIELLRTDKLLIPGTKIGVCVVISAGLFLIFATIVLVRGTMVKKREKIWKRRKEQLQKSLANAEEEETEAIEYPEGEESEAIEDPEEGTEAIEYPEEGLEAAGFPGREQELKNEQ